MCPDVLFPGACFGNLRTDTESSKSNIMKTRNTVTILFVALMLISTMGWAQSKSDRLFETFRNKPGVTYFAFNKQMTDAFNIDLDEEGKTIEGDVQEIRFMSYNPEKGQLDKNDFIQKSGKLLPASYKLVELDENDDDDATIWMLGNKRKAKEFHILVKGDDNDSMAFWISFYGDFNVRDLDGIKSVGLEMAND